jgi:hypothetical protein
MKKDENNHIIVDGAQLRRSPTHPHQSRVLFVHPSSTKDNGE